MVLTSGLRADPILRVPKRAFVQFGRVEADAGLGITRPLGSWVGP
jgi:hypothetical protein